MWRRCGVDVAFRGLRCSICRWPGMYEGVLCSGVEWCDVVWCLVVKGGEAWCGLL